jgi:hypothetical protein
LCEAVGFCLLRYLQVRDYRLLRNRTAQGTAP